MDYSDYSLEQLRTIPVPDPSKCDLAPLQAAFQKLGNSALLPWPQAYKCPVRIELDAAATTVLGIDPGEFIDWRDRIGREPTVSSKHRYARDVSDLPAYLMTMPTLEGLDLERDRSPMRDVEL